MATRGVLLGGGLGSFQEGGEIILLLVEKYGLWLVLSNKYTRIIDM